LEVNLEQNIALIEESIEFQNEARVFWKFRNWSLGVQSDVGMTRG